MYEKTCRCGKSKANFKIDIGPFFINDCCTEAGYDVQGNLPQKELTEEERALAAAAANSPDADNLTVNDDSTLDADEATFEEPQFEGYNVAAEPQQSPASEAAPIETKTSNKNKNKNKNKNS